jgi:hypothetical protein
VERAKGPIEPEFYFKFPTLVPKQEYRVRTDAECSVRLWKFVQMVRFYNDPGDHTQEKYPCTRVQIMPEKEPLISAFVFPQETYNVCYGAEINVSFNFKITSRQTHGFCENPVFA